MSIASLLDRIQLMSDIRTRFAPSPTGSLHIGGLRTALYSYALAKHSKGDFILRIEDTDKKREVAGGKEKIKETLKTFGITWDEYFVQSERLELYKKAAERLVKEGNAYEEEGAIRIKIPKGETVSFHDFVLDKDISWETDILQDLVLLKSDGFPTYHLAVVIDDNDMGITHVLRGHDWLPSTPIHLLLYRFLGFELPQIGHLTDILDPEGGKLSKRKGSTTCDELLKEGYLPSAILNFVMLLGWAPKDNREIFSLKEFVEAFDPKGFQKSNPVFNREKLDWFNGEYIRKMPDSEFYKLLEPFIPKNATEEKVKQIIPLIKDRVKKLSDFESLAGYVFKKAEDVKPMSITSNYTKHISNAKNALEGLDKSKWNTKTINITLDGIIKENNFKTGDFYMDLRGTIAGSKTTPPLNETLVPIGQEETIKRLENGLKKLK